MQLTIGEQVFRRHVESRLIGKELLASANPIVSVTLLIAMLVACTTTIETLSLPPTAITYVRHGQTASYALEGSTLAGIVRIQVATEDGVREVEFFVEKELVEVKLKIDDKAPFDLELDTSSLTNGAHRLRIHQKWKEGGKLAVASVTVGFLVHNNTAGTPPPAPGDSPDPPPDSPTPAVDEASCLETATGQLEKVTGRYQTEVDFTDLQAGARIDASGASFVMPYPGSEHPKDPFTVRGSPYVCVSGGVYSPGLPDDEPDWELYHHSQGVYLIDSVNPVVENVAIFESGDGIRFKEGTQGWTLRDSYVQHTGDDAVENDQLYSGLVDDILVDWTFVFLSCRLDTADRGTGYPPGGTVVVQNSLVALRPQVGAFKATNEGGRFFKWEKHDTPGCGLELRDNVFLVAEGEYADLFLDPSDSPDVDYTSLAHSSGNVIVWLGEGDYPAPIPNGFTLTRDISAWKTARDNWFDRHPRFAEFR